MSSLSDADIETLQSIGHDTIQSIVALCVESVLWSESSLELRMEDWADARRKAIYLVLVAVAGNILL